MNRIAHPQGAMGLKQPNLRFTNAERQFFTWAHDNCVCCLTGQPEFQMAHTGRKYTALKSPPWTCLPITHQLHLAEERDRKGFWEGVGFPDHLIWAERLWDHFTTGQNPTALLMDMRDRANKDFIVSILENAQ